jgi:hypothetical protein
LPTRGRTDGERVVENVEDLDPRHGLRGRDNSR